MQLDLSNSMVAILDCDIIDLTQINDAYVWALENTRALTLEVHVTLSELSAVQGLLERNDFRFSGTLTKGSPIAKTYARFKRPVRRSGDGVASAGALTPGVTMTDVSEVLKQTREPRVDPLAPPPVY